MVGITKTDKFRYTIPTNHLYAFMICGSKYRNLRKIGNKFRTYIRYYNQTGIFDISLNPGMNLGKTPKENEIALWDTINYIQYLERKNKTVIESFNNKYSIRDIAYILSLRHKFKTNKEFINTEYVSNGSIPCYCDYDQIEEAGIVCNLCMDNDRRRWIYNKTRIEFLNNN